MYSFILTLQLFLMLPALPLALMSHRTSRAHRSRHSSFLAVASLLAVLAAVFGLISLSVAFAGVEEQDWLLSFAPPVITLGACAFVIRRGLSPVHRRSQRSRSATRATSGFRAGAQGGEASGFQSSLHSGYQGSTHGAADGSMDGTTVGTTDGTNEGPTDGTTDSLTPVIAPATPHGPHRAADLASADAPGTPR